PQLTGRTSSPPSTPQPHRSTLFPYTTLFRSEDQSAELVHLCHWRLLRSVFLRHRRIGHWLDVLHAAQQCVFEFRGYAGGPRNSKDRKSTRLNSSHVEISYAVFCLKKTNRIKN